MPPTTVQGCKASLIVPVFNGEHFIGEALSSLRTERKVALEIIVVDDGSTDRSVDKVTALAEHDRRIRLIRCEHRGASAARNVGVRAASEEYIAFLDCDDICPSGRIARQVDKIAARPEIDVVIGETLWFQELTPNLEPAPGTRYLRILTPVLHSAVFRRSVFQKYGFFDENLQTSEDLDFFLRLWDEGALFFIEKELASLYRRHPDCITQQTGNHQKSGVLMAVLQKSIARRRASKRKRPHDIFFASHLTTNTVWNSLPTEAPK
jgi:glycosyltransferase involved in cell wall biosynthesis